MGSKFSCSSIELEQKPTNDENRFENRKTPLARGKSLNDWIRLMGSGVDLSGTGGKLIKVTEDDMRNHSELKNIWIILNGRVYNVAPYLEYHPGGADELMRAAGTDATDLFNEIHPWVAWESMLKGCLVGNFIGRRDSLRQIDPAVKDLESLTVTDSPKPSQNQTSNSYHRCKICAIKKVTHDTNFYILEPPEDWRETVPLPIGCHVYFKIPVEAVQVTRPYTLVAERISSKNHLDRSKFYFLIKIYQSGLLTKHLAALREGDFLEISDVFSPFNVKNLNSITKNILLFAAGTGITPFVRIINEMLSFDKNVFLFYFNKTKRDIIWAEEISETAKIHSNKFHVTNVLSEPDADWNGPRGRINEDMISDFIKKDFNFETSYVCVCGPTGFNDLTLSLLLKYGFTKERIHVFSG